MREIAEIMAHQRPAYGIGVGAWVNALEQIACFSVVCPVQRTTLPLQSYLGDVRTITGTIGALVGLAG